VGGGQCERWVLDVCIEWDFRSYSLPFPIPMQYFPFPVPFPMLLDVSEQIFK